MKSRPPNIFKRIAAALVGVLFLGIGVYALIHGDHLLAWRWPIGIVIITLGANALYAAATNRPTWLSKIGPLP